ncbi:transcriptional regulator [Halorubrum gandharaense]
MTVDLPELTPRNTRQQWTRSALAAVGGDEEEVPDFVVGTGHGVVRGFDADGTESWAVDLGGMAVALEPTLVDGKPVVLVGTRGETAVLALLDAVEGRVRWTHDIEADLGSATKETLFYYPMTVALASDTDRLYAAARRYERDGDDRHFESRVYAFDPDGSVAWTFDADASPIALDRRDDRLAVAYNRCHGAHQCGLVVLDAATGELDLTWDPGTDGGRRVGDVVLDADGVVVASHGDYRGYALDHDGRERWRVDLGRPMEREPASRGDGGDGADGGDVVYTYPNHVALAGDRALFVTGNTFPKAGRDTDARHPREHTLTAVDRERGTQAWTTPIGGWLGGTGRTGSAGAESAGAEGQGDHLLAVGQHFRDRDPDTHGVRVVVPQTGAVEHLRTDGVAVDVAAAGGRVATLEEPISYHDEDGHRGAHRLHLQDV